MQPYYYPPKPGAPMIKEPGKVSKFVRWCGRTTLWLVFWPVGLWRSARNRNAKRHRQLVNAVHANPHGPVTVYPAGQPSYSWPRTAPPAVPPPPPPPPPPLYRA